MCRFLLNFVQFSIIVSKVVIQESWTTTKCGWLQMWEEEGQTDLSQATNVNSDNNIEFFLSTFTDIASIIFIKYMFIDGIMRQSVCHTQAPTCNCWRSDFIAPVRQCSLKVLCYSKVCLEKVLWYDESIF